MFRDKDTTGGEACFVVRLLPSFGTPVDLSGSLRNVDLGLTNGRDFNTVTLVTTYGLTPRAGQRLVPVEEPVTQCDHCDDRNWCVSDYGTLGCERTSIIP